MGIESIKEELLQKAEQESSWQRKDAEREARDILEAAKDKAEGLMKSALAEAKKQSEKEHRKALEAATFESSTSILKAKKDLMDRTIREARLQLSSIPAEQRKRHMAILLERARKDISVDVVFCNKKDAPFVSGVSVKDAPISGGLIAENMERTMRVDLSYETLFAEVIEESMPQVYQALFASGSGETRAAANYSQENEKPRAESKSESKQKRAKK
jgi:vacuolar-type H+-ATPase subunit E/Vma4